MQLKDLFENFGKASSEQQLAYIISYRIKRSQDLEKILSVKKKQSAKTSKIDLSEEEKALMKLLGIKQKDIIALRNSTDTSDDVEESGDGSELFKENTFEEGDD